jgi:phospholipid/cholesterol/gamma-HCH transport system substrate-binding protein
MKWTYEARVGLIVFLALAVFVAGVMYLRGVDIRSKQYSLTVLYRNVSGLKTGDLVTVGGLAIGHVESMSLAGREIAVNLSITTKVQLATDSRAILKSETIMGGKFIEVSPGPGSVMLQDGDSLGGFYEADLSELTATLAPISTNVLGILENVNSTFDEPTRMRIQKIVTDLARTSAKLDQVVRSGGANAYRAFSDISSFSRDLAHVARTLDTLAVSQRGNVDTSLSSIRRVTRSLEDVSARLTTTTESLDIILARIRRGEGTLGKLVQDDRLYTNLDSLSLNLNLLVKDIRENPGRYLRVGLF